MSDYHIIETDLNLKIINAVFHIPIPTGNNTVGIPWRNALVSHLGGADSITSTLLNISPEELASIKSGEIHEYIRIIRFSSLDLTDSERLNEIKNAYTLSRTSILSDLQIILKYYGHSGDL